MLLLFTFSAFAQQSDSVVFRPAIRDRNLCLLTGINHNKDWGLELGLSKVIVGRSGYHPFAIGLAAGSEFYFNDQFMMAPKLSTWTAGGLAPMAIGVNAAYYSDFDQSALVFRPEIGLGLDFLS